jgi:hypothetical protein
MHERWPIATMVRVPSQLGNRMSAVRWSSAVLVVVVVWLAWAPVASAAGVLVMTRNGHVVLKDDRFVSGVMATASPSEKQMAHLTAARPPAGVTVRSTLAHLRRIGAISAAAYEIYLGDFNAALRAERRLSGARAAELESVTVTLHDIAVAGLLTPSRLPALFLTLNRNRQWWTNGPMLSYGQRIEFAGSQLLWEFYPGQGIQLTALGNFSKADAVCSSGAKYNFGCQQILGELIPLAAERAGGLTWEYYFTFDGGNPPWTSAMSQGTALQALADAYKATGNAEYLAVARRALPVFSVAPPTGVGVKTTLGVRYVQYTFDPARGDEVINAFLQTLIGLDDFAQTSRDPQAQRLFSEGNAEALAEVPQFNTGAWSLYQPGLEDDLSYHQLVTGFLQQLCGMTKAPTYCTTGADFQQDLKTPPALSLVTRRLRAGGQASVYFTVSKISRVGIMLLSGARTIFLTSGNFARGRHAFAVPVPSTAGAYTIRLDAADLAGNYAQQSFGITVS